MHPLTRFIRAELEGAARPQDAAAMYAYMKGVQPFRGVKTPARREIVRRAHARFDLEARCAYDTVVRELWSGTYREERYAALDLAAHYRRFHTLAALPLLEELLAGTDWWDVLDPLATGLLGKLLRAQGDTLRARARVWNAAPHLWTRRAAILVQLGHKRDTDPALLEEILASRLHEQEFFIRKAVGWALREYAKTDPGWVQDFVARHAEQICALSRREALRHL
ncbi:3-methyladenine DNA glycosylase AlkD [Deinobacterium chartae]|uniref:3-methyladenine DNA glycosylase AlkD n=1 Tax=Deinobacterium chartae TaxID=521158 RepID=A0A841I1T8_9DEIO|nr:DNA alkylation repair protein [Deinobacterium chartae]MBB6099026.1 3-methyladenine DNA glycosylase AlkD [Deinobacterium chartae]